MNQNRPATECNKLERVSQWKCWGSHPAIADSIPDSLSRSDKGKITVSEAYHITRSCRRARQEFRGQEADSAAARYTSMPKFRCSQIDGTGIYESVRTNPA